MKSLPRINPTGRVISEGCIRLPEPLTKIKSWGARIFTAHGYRLLDIYPDQSEGSSHLRNDGRLLLREPIKEAGLSREVVITTHDGSYIIWSRRDFNGYFNGDRFRGELERYLHRMHD